MVYNLFDIESLVGLKEFSKRLERVRDIEFRFIKIRTVFNVEK